MSNVFAKVETVVKKRFDLALAQYNIDHNCQLTQAEIIAHLLRKFSDSVLGKQYG